MKTSLLGVALAAPAAWAHHGEALDPSHWALHDAFALLLLVGAAAGTAWWLRRK
jgi:hypothetical protein